MRKQSTISKLAKYLQKYIVEIILTFVLSVISVALTIYLPIVIGEIVDNLVGVNQVNFTVIFSKLKLIVICVGIIAVCQWITGILNNNVVYNIIKDMRFDVFKHLQELPLTYLDNHSYGETVNKAINDIDQCADGLLLGFTQLFSSILTIVGTLIFMFYIDYATAIAVVVLTPITVLVSGFIASKTYNLFHDQSALRAKQTGFVEEMVGNQKVVQAFSQQENSLKDFDEINEQLTDVSVRATFFSSLTNPTTRMLNASIYAILALIGAIRVVGGFMTVGSLSSFLSYASQYTKPFNEISSVFTELQNSFACADRVFALMEEPSEIPDSPSAITLEETKGDVEFKDVAFSYTADKEFITDLNISVKQGQRIALIGPTGCGKTTIINLLMRFYDVNKGTISVDETPITEITRSSLRSNYGMVLQDTWLKSGTIKENIAMGNPKASDEEIVIAAKKAHADSFIRRLPNGYDTIISEDGGNLSQGQKQLLCISRLMLALPPLLILDEATSSIDTRTEIKIQDSFAKLMEGKTSFIVAHRLSTIREADLILVMKDGKIIEKGKHDDLLQLHGFYYELYNSQFEQ